MSKKGKHGQKQDIFLKCFLRGDPVIYILKNPN